MSDIVERLNDNVTWLMRDGFETSAKNVQCALAEIKSLHQQLAEKDAEIEQLKSENDELRWEVEQWKATNRENKLIAEQMAEPYKRELAASQAREQQLREALHYSLGAWHYDGVSEEHGSIFQEASYRCDSPADTAALQAMIKKAGEVMRRMILNVVPLPHWDDIQALPIITMDDLK